MTNPFSFRCQKIFCTYKEDETIKPILKDIDNAKQGVVTFSKEVKKYMLQFIHERYDDNQEVKTLIEILKNCSRYESFSEFTIFKLQEESYFWFDFLTCYALWKIVQKNKGFESDTEAIKLLVRLLRFDTTFFEEYKSFL